MKVASYNFRYRKILRNYFKCSDNELTRLWQMQHRIFDRYPTRQDMFKWMSNVIIKHILIKTTKH